METKKHTYNFIDLTGKRFGRWVVLKFIGKNKYKNAGWLCRCECGTEKVVDGYSLRCGDSKSCGCLRSESKVKIDMVGERYGKLVVEKFMYFKNHNSIWLCACDCGRKSLVPRGRLIDGSTRSCGCSKGEFVSTSKTRHGMAGGVNNKRHPVYRLWSGMRERCNNEKNPAYKNYGGRGISVCQEWGEFESFMSFCLANGWEHGLQIDRRDNNGNYCPENCRFVTRSVNSINTRKSKFWVIDGVKYESISVAAKKFSVTTGTIRNWCGLGNSGCREGCYAFLKYGESWST